MRFGWSGGGSRRRQAHEQEPATCKDGRLATLPCPAGARGAASVRGRRCLPLRGKSASELARLFWACRGRKQGFRVFCPSGKFTGAPENGGTGRCAFPCKEWRYTPSSRTERPFSRENLPHHPTAANAALYKLRLFNEESPARAPKINFSRLFAAFPRLLRPFRAHKSQLFIPSASPCPAQPSRGENGGLCPHPLKGSIP